ncbi:MAG: 2,3-bisphosphoglycerate-independent phosphoglycerate mutase [Acidobacteriota bacterium]|jgi:phosphoglycerate mutase (EC 5.4.2.1)|nr:2,3-bisphosphoglycerate-independent phosphoglycerate mutase [Acidobacteriota bacterium]OQB57272.1 MAG: cofactor-independent phosphoglycerate mutase [Candidatus Aminicenantes bacterium ADurb.Bin147]HNQ81394.1 2,3-bisphosphoglycerate-independent phosphoglycerate mutase [Candidatus Aminicenantes bacterium]MDD8009723.1 2,3-bisphosphoglycerate-independent phosphoglycerate mutase [Acidobacteriota bacterium]MDD8028378.1 2,3-bisphosphoglycerate-independent phosphoglycerate mutase [Acidobacteriota ba
MSFEELSRELAVQTDTKIVLFVIDGLGGLPRNGRTELETAAAPNLDRLAARSSCGLTDPVLMGVTPGSGPAHLALFGYDPLRHRLGRGILEALGSDVEVREGDLVARGNFATLKDGLIADRRAGRIPTSECERICAKINAARAGMSNPEITLFAGKEHRFVARFRAPGLSDALTDADPQKDGKPRVPASALDAASEKAASIVNTFLDEILGILKDEPAANAALLRGFSVQPTIPTMADLFKLRPAAIANYPMYKGLARLIGMHVYKVGPEPEDLFSALEARWKDHDFFYVHFKKTDAAGEDGNFEAKVRAIEEADRFLPRIEALKPDVLVVTADHSTPALMRGHSFHPNPFLLAAPTALPDDVVAFSERACAKGILGRFPSLRAMPLILGHAGKLKKYGA